MKRIRQMSQRVVLLAGLSAWMLWSGQGVVEAMVKPEGQSEKAQASVQAELPQVEPQSSDPSGKLRDPGKEGRLPSQEVRQPEYKKGELIVKFKDSVSECVHCLLQDKKSFAQVTTDRSHSLDKFFKKHSIKSTRLLFPQWHDKSVKSSKAKYQKSIEAAKRKFPKRTARAPKNAETPDLTHTYILEVAEDANIPILCQELQQDPHVKYAEPNYKVEVQMVPNDPYYYSSGSWGQPYDDLWGLKKIQCEQAWDISQGKGVVVAVVDTGLDYNHPDIAANVWTNAGEIPNNGIDDDQNGFVDDIKGWDFAYNDNDPMDGHGHGTHVSGTIAAVGNNGIGVIGVAPQVKFMPLKGLEDIGAGYIDRLVQAIRYAVDNGADITSNSWGSMVANILLGEVINYAYSNGVIAVAAAGNYNSSMRTYPASYNYVIAVAATEVNDQRASFSNYGDWVDVAAPGVDVLSLRANGTDMYGDGTHIVGVQYYRASGTSMACPHVSGVIGLLLSRFPNDSIEDIIKRVQYTADFTATDQPIGTGRVNAYRALAIPPQPFLSVIGHEVDDSRFGDGDKSIEPGETVELTITLKNLWTNATSASAILTSNDPYIQIGNAQAGFGNIPSGTTASNNQNPFNFTVALTAPNYHQAKLRVEITTAEGSMNYASIFIVVGMPPYQQGWPFRDLVGLIAGSVAVGDVEGDGNVEIAIGGFWSPTVYLLNHQGIPLAGWPKSGVFTSATSPAMGDLDGDGDLEIVIGDLGGISAWHHNGAVVSGWPKTAYSGIGSGFGNPTLADMDAIKGLEVICTYSNASVVSQLMVWRGDGSSVSGWPQRLNTLVSQPSNAPAVADLDKNGYNEIVMVTNGSSSNPAELYIFDHYGNNLKSWSMEAETFTSPVIGDLDLDGTLEIIAANVAGKVYVWHADGSDMNGWPIQTDVMPSKGMGLADLDGDGRLEVILAGEVNDHTSSKIYAWHYDGTPVGKFPVVVKKLGWLQSAPVIGDVDGDGDREIVIGFSDTTTGWLRGKIYIIHHDGTSTYIDLGMDEAADSTPALADLDNDGDIELIAGSGTPMTGTIHVFDIQFPYDPVNIEWPMFQHDRQRTGAKISRSFPINLKAGWNLVSFPGKLINPDPMALKKKGSEILYPLYRWNADGYNYVEATELKPTEGYWILTFKDEVIEVPLTPITEYSLALKKDHNYMIGSVYGTAWQESGGKVSQVFEYDPISMKYREVNQIEHGKGYWAVASEDCTMRVATDITPSLLVNPQVIKGEGNPPAFVINNAPSAQGQMVSVTEETAQEITLAGSDVEGDTLSYSIVSQPIYGTLSGLSGAKVIYTPEKDYSGTDSFTFKVSDGDLESDPATVSITVVNANQPSAVSRCWLFPRFAKQGQRVYFKGWGSDSDGKITAYSWRSSTNGQLSTASSFTTRKLSVGEHTIYFKVQDNEGVWSEETTRKVTVKKVRR